MPEYLPFFLLAVAFGAYIQTVTGFAFSIFLLAAVTLFHLAPIPLTATALNIMNLALASVVVLPGLHKVDYRILWQFLLGMLPAMAVGVVALSYLNENAQQILKLLLGLVILAGGLVLAWRPDPLKSRSGSAGFVIAGAVGGFFGGLFSVAGPPVVYQAYRQPLTLATIRMTLLTLFSISAAGRLGMVAVHGDLTMEVIKTGVISIPVVMLAAWLGRRFPPPVSERTLRRFAFILLMLSGALVIFTAI